MGKSLEKAIVIGAGKIGIAVGEMLQEAGDFEVQIADIHEQVFESGQYVDLNPLVLDVSDQKALRDALEGRDTVISTLPYYFDLQVAQAAADVGVHYFDPTEDIHTARKIRKLAEDAKSVFVPQCGLA